MQRVVFHLPRSWLGPSGKGLAPFYRVLTDGLRARGVACDLTRLDRDTVLQRVEYDNDAFHIINHGRFEHPRVLNAGVAYVYPFWNMDPKGIRAFSSIADLPFDPRVVDAEKARPFYRALRKRLVGKRRSRYAQPEARAHLPDAPVAVFLQSESHRGLEETCYLSQFDMLETVLHSCSGPVVVKPHPLESDPKTDVRLSKLKQNFPQLSVQNCNIHDLIAAAARVVTINSAVAIEAFLHRKPVILCGRADFHHIADVARTPQDLALMLGEKPKRRAYDKFVYWYFGIHCLSTTQPDLVDRFLERVTLASKWP